MERIVDSINVNRDRYIDELKQYLAIPSISALPQHAGDVRRGAEWTAEEMRRIGLQNVRVEETPGHPAVYGEWLGADGAPTILFYGHYDVQPVDPVNLWTSPPFEATVRDGELYARGSVDDKGQVFMHFKAVEAHMKANGRLPVNMKFLIEGEEEVGSANLDNYVRDHKAQLAADVHGRAFREQLERVTPVPKVPEWERIANEMRLVAERAVYGHLSLDAAAAELDARAGRILEKRRFMLARNAGG